jgi:hypothetical protein
MAAALIGASAGTAAFGAGELAIEAGRDTMSESTIERSRTARTARLVQTYRSRSPPTPAMH